MVRDVYAPLGMSRGFRTTLCTSENNWQGQALGSKGLFWTGDDIAKLATFLNTDGSLRRRQILHPELLAAAVQRDASQRGLDADVQWKYRLGFHAFQYLESELWPGRRELWVPFMLGAGGVLIVIMPNGSVYYQVTDNREGGSVGNYVRELVLHTRPEE